MTHKTSKYTNRNKKNHTQSTKCQYKHTTYKKTKRVSILKKLKHLPKHINNKKIPKKTWLKCNKSIKNNIEPKTPQLHVTNNNENSHTWFHKNKKPNSIAAHNTNNTHKKKRNQNKNNTKLTNNPLTNNKNVLISKLNTSIKYQ